MRSSITCLRKRAFTTALLRPGAGGRIALAAVKNARPDGQTVTPISLLAHVQFGVVSGPATGVTLD